MKNLIIATLYLLCILLSTNQLQARVEVTLAKRFIQLSKITANHGDDVVRIMCKFEKVIPESQIDELAKIAKNPNGLKEVNKILGQMNLVGRYGDDGYKMISLTHLQIAIKNGLFKLDEATDIYKYLGDTKGFSSLMSKLNTVNINVQKGHLQELKIGLNFKKAGHSVEEFGRHFSDGVKLHDTDLDVLIKLKNGKYIAIESKAYDSAIDTAMVRGDMQSLKYFCEHLETKNVQGVFCFKQAPPVRAQEVLKAGNCQWVAGTEEEICRLLELFAK